MAGNASDASNGFVVLTSGARAERPSLLNALTASRLVSRTRETLVGSAQKYRGGIHTEATTWRQSLPVDCVTAGSACAVPTLTV
jgi:hypothetical protein